MIYNADFDTEWEGEAPIDKPAEAICKAICKASGGDRDEELNDGHYD